MMTKACCALRGPDDCPEPAPNFYEGMWFCPEHWLQLQLGGHLDCRVENVPIELLIGGGLAES